MSERNCGGAAFPRSYSVEEDGQLEKINYNYAQTGMTLRDWFAGQIIPALFNGITMGALDQGDNPHFREELAKLAYQFSDAMLKERDRQETKP